MGWGVAFGVRADRESRARCVGESLGLGCVAFIVQAGQESRARRVGESLGLGVCSESGDCPWHFPTTSEP